MRNKRSKTIQINNQNSSSFNEHSFLNIDISLSQTSKKRVRTQHTKHLQPLKLITNDVNFMHSGMSKLYPFTRDSLQDMDMSSIQSDECPENKVMSNFQLLKKQAQNLECSHIMKRKQSDSLPYAKQLQQQQGQKWNQSPSFVINRQFSCGKKVSLLERHRQNIKKVMKNKRFRKCLKTSICATSVQADQQNPTKITHVRASGPMSIILPSNSKLKQRVETPQAVRRFYRPQSCKNEKKNQRQKSPLSKKSPKCGILGLNLPLKESEPIIKPTFSSKVKYNVKRKVSEPRNNYSKQILVIF